MILGVWLSFPLALCDTDTTKMRDQPMTGKTPKKRIKQQTQHADGKAAPANLSPSEDDQLVHKHGAHTQDTNTSSEADEESLRRHFAEHYNWDNLVRIHGVEGAERILDCIDFDF